jgi:hypothetical protein
VEAQPGRAPGEDEEAQEAPVAEGTAPREREALARVLYLEPAVTDGFRAHLIAPAPRGQDDIDAREGQHGSIVSPLTDDLQMVIAVTGNP